MFSDIEGSTRLLERLGPERYGEALDLHRRLLRDAFVPIALKPFIDPDTGLAVSPEAEPERFVLALHRHLNGDYLFATQAHDAVH